VQLAGKRGDALHCGCVLAIGYLKQDGRQRNSDPIHVVFRNILGTEMKMYGVAIAQVE
jgi:hypothetical protein